MSDPWKKSCSKKKHNDKLNSHGCLSRKGSKSQDVAGSSNAAREAGRAALARLTSNGETPPFMNSFAGLHEVETKMSSTSAVEEFRYSSTTKERSKEALAVEGVFFKCPLLGSEILTRYEWKSKIREFLYQQLETEKGVTSCLMIYTLNKASEVSACVETLCSILQNIINNPKEEKYKKIRLENKKFQEKVSKIEGALDFLESAGFVRTNSTKDSNDETYYVYPLSNPDIPYLLKMIDSLNNTKPMSLELDRNVKVLKPVQAFRMLDLPDDFFDLRREQIKRTGTIENAGHLMTKEMREKENQRKKTHYRYSLVRVRFPDGIYLQGTFGVTEPFRAVRKFVRECVTNVKAFCLNTPFGVTITESEDERTLAELNLMAAVLLIFVPVRTQLRSQSSYLVSGLRKIS